MKKIVHFTFALCLLSCCILAQVTTSHIEGATKVFEVTGPPLDEKVQELIRAIRDRDNIYIKNKNPVSAEYIRKQFESLPEITDQLFNHLQFQLSINNEQWNYLADSETIVILIQGLTFRKDLTSSQVEWISNTLLEYKNISQDKRDHPDVNFLLSGILLLQDYPTPANEEVALTLLSDTDLLLQTNVLKTLHKIGTIKSIPALQDKAEEYKSGALNDRYEETMQTIQAITTREKLKKQAPQSTDNSNNSTLKPNQSTSNASSPSSSFSGNSSFSFWWILWAIAIVMVVRILWKLIRTLYDSF